MFLVKIHACRVKNAGKVSNLAALFFLQARIFPQKTVSQTKCKQPLSRRAAASGGRLKIRIRRCRCGRAAFYSGYRSKVSIAGRTSARQNIG
ncbi:hypothetical protein HMPREF9123_2536 [Neisseria bacilliformis ATCC BAA-1200]|uniref:Uncharacterized protein n=1 Tax=Neisseria bacilliformis ATCC BAA-1200 TaxID=888742 RepID=F2BFM9_9NEIS|nr:hypothetical protein HMPREF9123_2536 [Neisseria bacilliformis ATCC BAA-1200]